MNAMKFLFYIAPYASRPTCGMRIGKGAASNLNIPGNNGKSNPIFA